MQSNNLIIHIHVKEKIFPISCGVGAQPIKWLADVACQKYDDLFGLHTGPIKGLKFENGGLLQMDGIINLNLENDMEIYSILKDEYDSIQSKNSKSQKGKDKKLVKK